MRALITGILGQDGGYLAEFLLQKGYEVVGLANRPSFTGRWVRPLLREKNLTFVTGTLEDRDSIVAAVRRTMPDEIYNLGAMSFVPPSWDAPDRAMRLNAGGLGNILDAALKIVPQARIYQAGTSEMFGDTPSISEEEERLGIRFCNEERTMRPVSPYAAAKLAAHHLCRIYRNRGLYVVGGILMNHESPRRGEEMVTRKITRQVARWVTGNKDQLRLGNMNSARDWSFAGEIVEMMWAMLQQSEPDDYVVGSGRPTTIKEFILAALQVAGFSSPQVDYYAEQLTVTDPRFVRVSEPAVIVADNKKARTKLGWNPQVGIEELARMMVEADLEELGA